MSDLMLDVDQAGELKAAFRRGGWTNKEIKMLCEGNTLAIVRKLLHAYVVPDKNGGHKVVLDHIVNLDAPAFVPDGWNVEKHQKGGWFEWNPSKVSLYVTKTQQSGVIDTNKLREEFKEKNAFNANLLDYLLDNPSLIPEEWEGKCISFAGTIYRSLLGGELLVRCLCRHGKRWTWCLDRLDADFDRDNPVAIPAS